MQLHRRKIVVFKDKFSNPEHAKMDYLSQNSCKIGWHNSMIIHTYISRMEKIKVCVHDLQLVFTIFQPMHCLPRVICIINMYM